MIYAAPGQAGAKIQYKARYDNFIGGQWTAPVKGQYFDVITPINDKVYAQAARSDAAEIPLTVDHIRYFASCVCAREGATDLTIGPYDVQLGEVGGVPFYIGKAFHTRSRLFTDEEWAQIEEQVMRDLA